MPCFILLPSIRKTSTCDMHIYSCQSRLKNWNIHKLLENLMEEKFKIKANVMILNHTI